MSVRSGHSANLSKYQLVVYVCTLGICMDTDMEASEYSEMVLAVSVKEIPQFSHVDESFTFLFVGKV